MPVLDLALSISLQAVPWTDEAFLDLDRAPCRCTDLFSFSFYTKLIIVRVSQAVIAVSTKASGLVRSA